MIKIYFPTFKFFPKNFAVNWRKNFSLIYIVREHTERKHSVALTPAPAGEPEVREHKEEQHRDIPLLDTQEVQVIDSAKS